MLQALTRWESVPQFNDVLRPGFRTWIPGAFSDVASYVPSFYDDDDHERLVVTIDMPGVTAADVDLEIEPRSLTMRASRRRGDSTLSYNQRWNLNATVDAERAHACLEDGVLTVVLPKIAPRKIAIQAMGSATDVDKTGPFTRFWTWMRKTIHL